VENSKLFYSLLKELQKSGLLEDIVLVGSWCLDFYRNDFENSFFIPAVRTNDADFLIPKIPRVSHTVDIPAILDSFDFTIEYDYQTGLSIFNHPELKVEFLTVLSRGGKQFYTFDMLNVTAQELAFMDIPLRYNYQSTLNGVTVKIPEAEAFVLHKLLVVDRRPDPLKRLKDLESVEGLFMYFTGKPHHIKRITTILREFPAKQQKTIRQMIEKYNLIFPE